MQQTFQCYGCGAQNYVNQPVCWNCHSHIQFNCPNCHALVQSTLAYCPYCGSPLSWQLNKHAQPVYFQAQRSHQELKKRTGRNLWLIGILAAVLIAIVGGGAVFGIPNSEFSQKLSAILPQSKLPAFTPHASTDFPRITDVNVCAISINEATICWTTNQPSSSRVIWGITYEVISRHSTPISDDPTTDKSQGVIDHRVLISGLAGGTTYHYEVSSKNSAGLTTTVSPSEDTFITLPEKQ